MKAAWLFKMRLNFRHLFLTWRLDSYSVLKSATGSGFTCLDCHRLSVMQSKTSSPLVSQSLRHLCPSMVTFKCLS